MGWFSKKEEKKKGVAPSNSNLPNLPRLPDLDFPKESPTKDISQLPSFPNNFTGEKFSRNTIKEAVGGKEENEEDDMFPQETPEPKPIFHKPPTLLPRPQQNNFHKELEVKKPLIRKSLHSQKQSSKEKQEPLFVRIDKFEESLDNLEEVKKQIVEIEKLLVETKELKEKEGAELDEWQNEIKSVKEKVEKIDTEIFSKMD